MSTDPVCGMYVDDRSADLRTVRDNRTYYFCSHACLETFVAPAQRLRLLRRKLVIAWPLSALVVALTYGAHFDAAAYLAFVAASVVQFYPGLEFYRGFLDALRSRVANMDVLIATGTTAAYAYSAVVLFVPTGLPREYFFDASSLIISLILTGNYLEYLTRARAGSALRRLGELSPTAAHRASPTGEVDVPVSSLEHEDRVKVRAGERFPADGSILAGRSEVDTSLLTGELTPEARGPGDRVLAGMQNGSGVLEVGVDQAGPDTFLAHLQQLMTDGELNQVPMQRYADRIAAAFVPVVLILGIGAAVGWFVFGGAPGTVALLIFVTVVITACPCAFGIATPAAVVVATGRAAEAGILFKSRDAIERTATADVVLIDKTGTVTEGRPRLAGAAVPPGTNERDVLALAASIEAGSDHPLARAVVEAARNREIPTAPAANVRVMPGVGIIGEVGGHAVEVRAASTPVLGEDSWAVRSGDLARIQANGQTASAVYVDGTLGAVFAFEDPVRPEVPRAIREISYLGLETVLVSGDNAAAVGRAAQAAGVHDFRAEVRPDQKVGIVETFRSRGHHPAFVGDGLNDAPALLAADVGIAIGTGADLARESGRVILIRPELPGVPLAIRTARRTVAKVRQNIGWAIGYNAVLLPIAAGALVPWLGFAVYGILPVLGAVAMAVSSTTVLLNSLSLRRIPDSLPGRTGRDASGSAAPT